MIDTRKIREALERAYAAGCKEQRPVEVPLPLQATQMASRAKEYISAASLLDAEAPQHILPRFQLTGLAVELSLKACLASVGFSPPRGHDGHDLCKLYDLVQAQGFELNEELQYAAIVHLQHLYYQDLGTGAKYKVRYPPDRSESMGGALPQASTFVSVVNTLLNQACSKGS